MNILQSLLMLSALTSLLVTGPNLVPVQSYAAAGDSDNRDDKKSTKDYENSIHKDVNAKSEITDQHLNQDSLCYRSPECKQANEGQQIAGKDNTANGFNDQSKNIEQQQQQSAISPTSPGNGTTPPTPGPSTLTVSKDVICNFTPSSDVECPTVDEFNITATTSNGSSLTFSGSESGTPLTINPPFPVTYQGNRDQPNTGICCGHHTCWVKFTWHCL